MPVYCDEAFEDQSEVDPVHALCLVVEDDHDVGGPQVCRVNHTLTDVPHSAASMCTSSYSESMNRCEALNDYNYICFVDGTTYTLDVVIIISSLKHCLLSPVV